MNEAAYSSRYRFVIGGFTLWSQLAPSLSMMAVAPILPQITDEYGLTHATAGLLIGVVAIVQAVGSVPAGIVAGRLGVWRTCAISWLLMGMVVLSAVAPGFYTLLALRVLLGLGMAGIMPAAGPLIMQWFRAKERPVISGLNQAGASLGIMVAVVSTAPLADVLGWQRALGLFGAVGLVGAFAWIIFGKTHEGADSTAEPLAWREISGLLARPAILLLGLAHAGCLGQQIGLSGWLPTFYQDTRGMSPTAAGFTTGLLPFMVTAGLLLGGFLPLKLANRRLFLIVPGLMVGLGGLGTFLIDQTAVTYLALAVLGLGSGLYAPTLMVMPMEFPGITPKGIAVVWGWILMAGGLSAFFAPLLVGAIKEVFDSFMAGFLVLAALSWLMFFVGWLLPRTYLGEAGAPSVIAAPTPGTE